MIRINCKLTNLFKLSALALVLTINANTALATSLEDSIDFRDNFAFSVNAAARSYDGSNFDAIGNFDGFITPGEILEINTFDALPSGSNLEVTLLTEVCGYCGHDPLNSNQFGIINEEGEFVSVIDTAEAGPGSTETIVIPDGTSATLALKSPDAILSSIDTDNEDQSAHLLGAIVQKSGTVTIEEADLNGASLTFDLLVGDVIVFIEDLLATGNSVSFVPDTSDFDFNDMVLLLRETAVLADSEDMTEVVESFEDGMVGADSTEVPEPATVALLTIGFLGLIARKRKA